MRVPRVQREEEGGGSPSCFYLGIPTNRDTLNIPLKSYHPLYRNPLKGYFGNPHWSPDGGSHVSPCANARLQFGEGQLGEQLARQKKHNP